MLEAFHREFYDNDSGILGCSNEIYENNATNIQDLAQLHSTEDRSRKYLFSKAFVSLATRELALSFMPRGSILRLYFVEAPSWRIAIIVMLTLVFAICARFLADGKRLAVFAACAAYAAVLVVFVSENYTLAERAFSFRVHQRSASTVPKF